MSNEIKNKIDAALFNFYLEADKETIKDLLKDEIENPDEYVKKKKQIMFLANATLKQKHNEYLLEAVKKFQEAILLNIEKPISVLRQLIESNSSPALCRSLDKLSKEDIVEIIKDKNLVELLEKIEENDKSH